MDLHKHIAFGGKRDAHDSRDIAFRPAVASPPASVDLRPCVCVYNQLPLQSCSANAIASMFEFVARKAQQTIEPPSRLFIYYNERKAEGTQATDCGATIRNGMKAIAKQGICSEASWPYDPDKVTIEPPAECYQQAKATHAISYSRLNDPLANGKACLAEGFPFVFGMQVYWNIVTAQTTGHLTLPGPNDKFMAGHAVMAVGYDDTAQTLLVLNSLGTNWGMSGFFTLPYAYVTNPDLAYDFWTLRRVV